MDINETLRDAQYKDASPVKTVEKIWGIKPVAVYGKAEWNHHRCCQFVAFATQFDAHLQIYTFLPSKKTRNQGRECIHHASQKQDDNYQ